MIICVRKLLSTSVPNSITVASRPTARRLERYFKSQEEPSGSQGEREKRFEVNLKRRRRRRRREGEREREYLLQMQRERDRARARERERQTEPEPPVSFPFRGPTFQLLGFLLFPLRSSFFVFSGFLTSGYTFEVYRIPHTSDVTLTSPCVTFFSFYWLLQHVVVMVMVTGVYCECECEYLCLIFSRPPMPPAHALDPRPMPMRG